MSTSPVIGTVSSLTLNASTSNITEFVATSNLTTFTISYAVGAILVFLNGVALEPTNDYTLTGTTMTLVGGAPPTGSSLVVRYLPLTG